MTSISITPTGANPMAIKGSCELTPEKYPLETPACPSGYVHTSARFSLRGRAVSYYDRFLRGTA